MLRRLAWAWIPALAWMAFIFLISTDSNPYRAFPNAHQPAGSSPTGLDSKGRAITDLRPPYEALGRAAHAVEFALLGWLCSRSTVLTITGITKFTDKRRFAVAVFLGCLLSMAFGVSDEWHQSFVAGRTLQSVDLLLDSLGSTAGALIYLRLDSVPTSHLYRFFCAASWK